MLTLVRKIVYDDSRIKWNWVCPASSGNQTSVWVRTECGFPCAELNRIARGPTCETQEAKREAKREHVISIVPQHGRRGRLWKKATRMTQKPLGGISDIGARWCLRLPSVDFADRSKDSSDWHLQRMWSKSFLTVCSAVPFGLDTVGITSRFCVTPRHDGTGFLHCGEGFLVSRRHKCPNYPIIAVTPRDDGTVFLDCGESETIAHDVANTTLQLGLHGIWVASIMCAAQRHNRAPFFGGNKSGVRPDDVLDSSDLTPWEFPPSCASPHVTIRKRNHYRRRGEHRNANRTSRRPSYLIHLRDSPWR